MFRVEHHSFSIVLMDDPMVENDCFNFSLALGIVTFIFFQLLLDFIRLILFLSHMAWKSNLQGALGSDKIYLDLLGHL